MEEEYLVSSGGESCEVKNQQNAMNTPVGGLSEGEYYTSHKFTFVKFNFMFVCVSVGRLGHGGMKL